MKTYSKVDCCISGSIGLVTMVIGYLLLFSSVIGGLLIIGLGGYFCYESIWLIKCHKVIK